MDIESKLNDVTVTAIPMSGSSLNKLQQLPQNLNLSPPPAMTITTTRISADITTPLTSVNSIPSSIGNSSGLSKYGQLLSLIEEMGRDIRPTYSGSRSSAERLKRGKFCELHSRSFRSAESNHLWCLFDQELYTPGFWCENVYWRRNDQLDNEYWDHVRSSFSGGVVHNIPNVFVSPSYLSFCIIPLNELLE